MSGSAQALTPLRIRGVEHVAVAVKDMGSARAALEGLGLQMELEEDWPEYHARMAWYPTGNTAIELLEGTAEAPLVGEWLGAGAGFFHVCLEVDDLATALEALRGRGIGLLGEPHAGHGGRLVCFLDPDATAGLLFELVEAVPQDTKEAVP